LPYLSFFQHFALTLGCSLINPVEMNNCTLSNCFEILTIMMQSVHWKLNFFESLTELRRLKRLLIEVWECFILAV
jgi:hypothetical protein